MAGETEVCGLHGQIASDINQMNKDIGKLAVSQARVEENTKQIPQMAIDIQALK